MSSNDLNTQNQPILCVCVSRPSLPQAHNELNNDIVDVTIITLSCQIQ